MILVTLYTKKGKPYVVEGVFCKHCLESSSSDSDGEQKLTVPTQDPEKMNEHDLKENEKKPDKSDKEYLSLLDPLLTESQVPVSKTPLEVNETERVSGCNIILTLNWLNTKLMLKDWKRFILPAIALCLWACFLVMLSHFSFPIIRCSDGR